MFTKRRLHIPGPIPIPDRVVRAASAPMINHRGPEFADLLSDCVEGLQWALGTTNDILMFPASGTGGMEAALANILSPGERALFCGGGAFAERWAEMARTFGADPVELHVEWGATIEPTDVEEILAAQGGEIRTVFVTHNETSTGVTHDLAAIARVVKSTGRLLVVDSVSAAGCLPLAVDELGLDVVLTSSQKGWLAPPGLAMAAVSPDALRVCAESKCARWYFDFLREKSFQDDLQTYTTPPLSVLYALREGLAMMREEGMDEIWRRHHRVAEAIRAGLVALDLRLLGPAGHWSDTVTAVHSPFEDPDDLRPFLARLESDHGLVIAGGQEKLKGRIIRIGHLGAVDEADAYTIIGILEQALYEEGVVDRTGIGIVAAAQAGLPAAVEGADASIAVGGQAQ